MKDKHFKHLTLAEREKISLEIVARGSGSRSKSWWLFLFELVVLVFAIIGFGFLAVYFGVNLHLTNTEGIIDKQTEVFWENSKNTHNLVAKGELNDPFFNGVNYCSLKRLKKDYSATFWRVLTLALTDKKDLAQNNLDVAIKNLNMVSGQPPFCSESVSKNISKQDFESLANLADNKSLFLFANSSEWFFFKSGAIKDQETIKRVEKETGIKSRILVSQLVAEQLRLFYSDRVWFEKVISPFKIFASMSQFSWGVLGIKQETAERVESNLKAKDSVFYLGTDYENKLDFNSVNINQERFKRITDPRDHYYAYLYAALFNKQIITQWQKSGIDISNRPEVLATIYNIGFGHSKPKENPQMGGAELNIDGNVYSFGRLAYEFYYSGELLDEFPQ
jgi:hypothetical protein